MFGWKSLTWHRLHLAAPVFLFLTVKNRKRARLISGASKCWLSCFSVYASKVFTHIASFSSCPFSFTRGWEVKVFRMRVKAHFKLWASVDSTFTYRRLPTSLKCPREPIKYRAYLSKQQDSSWNDTEINKTPTEPSSWRTRKKRSCNVIRRHQGPHSATKLSSIIGGALSRVFFRSSSSQRRAFD